MNTTVRAGAVVLLLLTATTAQVSPVAFANAEGPAALVPAVGTLLLDRHLQVDAELVGLGPRTIRGLRFRRDGLTRTPNPAFRIVVDVWVSHAATTPGAPSATFDHNHGADRTHVVQGQQVSFPASVAYGLPEPFKFEVPFQSSFAYDGMRPLCWDIYVSQTTNTVQLVGDAVAGGLNNPQPIGIQFGSGCRATGLTNPALLAGAASANWGTPRLLRFSYSAGRLPANSSGLLLIDLLRLEPPLPFGACSLYVAPAAYLPLLTQANGTASTTFELPASPAYNGLSLFTQVVAADPLATPVGLVMTNAVQFNIVAPFTPKVGSVRAFGPLPRIGAVASGLGSIVQYF